MTIKEIKVKLINYFPPKSFFAIILFGNLYIRKTNKDRWNNMIKNKTSNIILTHEMFHVIQAKDNNGWINFYIKYIYYFLKMFIVTLNFNESSYTSPFEIEAYLKETSLEWYTLYPRNKFSEWKKFIFSIKDRKKIYNEWKKTDMIYGDFLKLYFDNNI